MVFIEIAPQTGRTAVSDVTQILSAIEQGETQAAEQLLPLVYDELRRLAAQNMAQETPGQTLQATALVHEAYIRLVDVDKVKHWNSRGHFFAAAAEAMRRILVEQARRKKSLKGGGGRLRLDLGAADVTVTADPPPDDLLSLDEALAKPAKEDAEAAELAKLRLFVGLSVEEAAESLGLSRTTGFRAWSYARAWLHLAMQSEDDEPGD